MKTYFPLLCLLVFLAAGISSQENDFSPVQGTAKPENQKRTYYAQLIKGPDQNPGDKIDLGFEIIHLNIDDKNMLGYRATDKGSFRRVSRPVPISFALKNPETKKKFPLKILFNRRDDGSWYYRNTIQLTVKLGDDTFVVVDANCNGKYNEAGIDGMTWDGRQFLFPLPSEKEVFCSQNNVYTGFTMGPWGEDPQARVKPLSTAVPGALPVLKGTNAERVRVGLVPRPDNPKLSADLQKHCKYMTIHKNLQHNEDKGKAGYSPEGHNAGMNSILSMGRPADQVAYGMVQTYFHRQDVLRPGTLSFGVGYDGSYGGINGRQALDTSIPSSWWPVLYPAPNQENCGTQFSRESPDPIPGDSSAGLPITVYFNEKNVLIKKQELIEIGPASVKRMSATAPGTRRHTKEAEPSPVDCYLYDSKQGAQVSFTKFQKCACLIPKDPLKANTRYKVTMELEVSGKPWKKTWEFTTGAQAQRGWRR